KQVENQGDRDDSDDRDLAGTHPMSLSPEAGRFSVSVNLGRKSAANAPAGCAPNLQLVAQSADAEHEYRLSKALLPAGQVTTFITTYCTRCVDLSESPLA